MSAVSETHGALWMQTLDRLMGGQHAEQREDFAKELISRVKYELQHPMLNIEVWDSGTNVSVDHEDVDKCHTEPVQLQHNQPESSVLVSFLEQAFEFFQHDSHGKLCHLITLQYYLAMQKAFLRDRTGDKFTCTSL